MSKNNKLCGGCLCGALRYELDGSPLDAGYCHCRLCQRSAGAPVLVWGTWKAEAFNWVRGRAQAFASSAKARRYFCRLCGTQLVFRVAKDSKTVDVTLASLDLPEAVRPEYHIWRQSKISWFDTADDLPRHAAAGPDSWD